MRLAVMTTTWKRPELTEAVLDWWGYIIFQHWPDCAGLACGDYGGSSLRQHLNGWFTLWAENEPIGHKHNVAIGALKGSNPDAVLVIGSDDICEPRLIENTVKALEAGALWTQPRELYYWHPETNRCAKVPRDSVGGGGRAYSRRLLDMLNWKLWDDDATAKLDGNALKNIENLIHSTRTVFGDAEKGHYHMLGARDVDGAVLSIKTDENLWPYDDAVAITRAVPVDSSILERFEIQRFTYGR